MPRYKKFTFTLNNYGDLDFINIETFKNTYLSGLAYSKEIGGTKGTPHLQGYFVTKKGFTKKDIIQKLHEFELKPHIEIMKGTIEQNLTYCSKESELVSQGTFETLKPNLETAIQVMEDDIHFAEWYKMYSKYSYEERLHYCNYEHPNKKHFFQTDIDRIMLIFAKKCPIQYIRHYTGFIRYIKATLINKFIDMSQPSITCH